MFCVNLIYDVHLKRNYDIVLSAAPHGGIREEDASLALIQGVSHP